MTEIKYFGNFRVLTFLAIGLLFIHFSRSSADAFLGGSNTSVSFAVLTVEYPCLTCLEDLITNKFEVDRIRDPTFETLRITLRSMALLCTIFRDLWNIRTTICKGILTPHGCGSLKIIALQNIQSKYFKQPRHNNKLNMAEVDPKRIDGVAIGGQIRAEIKKEVESLKAAGKRVPGIGVILVGDRKDSTTYVNMKQKACVEAGIHFVFKKLSDQASQDDIINAGKLILILYIVINNQYIFEYCQKIFQLIFLWIYAAFTLVILIS
jgi:hypothetical protein